MKKEVYVIIVLFFFVVFASLTVKVANTIIDRGSVERFVLEDLQSKFPDADKIEIISNELVEENKSTYHIVKGRVSYGLSTPCPNRTHYYYYYPEQNFIPHPPEYIVKDCTFSGIIDFEEEAIIASHTLPGSEMIKNFISRCKGAEPKHVVLVNESAWKVRWMAPSEGKDYYCDCVELTAIVHKNGTILSVYSEDACQS